MTQQVIYELGLRDKNFTPGVLNADGAVRKLESSIGKVIGAGFAMFAGFSFLQGTVQDFNAAEQASAQLNATLKSTGNIAGLNRKALDEQASALMNKSLFDDDDITRAQSILATFTNIRGEVFMNTIPAVADLATKMGTDLKGAVIQVGKALQDTTGKGLTMLKKSGVDFSESQLKVIKSLFATGKAAEAQTLILQELNKEFGGSAAAAAAAGTGPFTVLQHQFANVKEEIGGMLVALGIELMPVLKKFVELIKDGVEWIKRHAAAIKTVAVALGTAWAAFKIIAGAQVILLGIENALVAAAAGGTTFGASMLAALGPIGLIAAAVGGLVAVFSVLRDRITEAREANTKFVSDSRTKEGEYIQTMADFYGKDKKGLDETLTKEKESLKKDRDAALIKLNASKNTDEIAMLNTSISATHARINEIDRYQQGLGLTNAVKPVKPVPDLTSKLAKDKAPKTQATGAKAVTINVDIRELIGIKEFKTTNIKEGITRLKDAVVGVMTGAVNDFQIVAAGT